MRVLPSKRIYRDRIRFEVIDGAAVSSPIRTFGLQEFITLAERDRLDNGFLLWF